MFNEFPEQQAICAFFLDFVLLPRHPDSVRGHLEHLLPLYQHTSPESPLALATSSVALAISSTNPTRSPSSQQLARTIFGRALRKTSTAIRDPITSLKDETLMAVLLLGLFERISATSSPHSATHTNMTSTHNAGAAALVKHRGAENCKSPLAIGLLFAVRTQLVEHAIEEGTAFKRCPDQLSAIFKALPQNAASRLTSSTINIADLRSCAKSALQLPHSAAAKREVTDLLEYAISIDLLVAAWPDSVPEAWKWEAGTHFDLPTRATHGYEAPTSAFLYAADKKDVYLDLWVMSIWNQYRAARIRIQSIILACIAYLGPEHEPQWYWRSIYAKMIAQQMSSEICASVPFALGTKTMGAGVGALVEDVHFPYVAGKGRQSDEHRRAAAALGGWHLLDPLRTVFRLRKESRTEGVLREGMAEWCVAQMERVGRIYGLQGERGQHTSSPTETVPQWTTSPTQLSPVEAAVQRQQQHTSPPRPTSPVQASTYLPGGRDDPHGNFGRFRVEQAEQADGGVWGRRSFEFPV